MKMFSVPAIALAGFAALAATPSAVLAHDVDVDVDVYRPRTVYVAPAPRVVVVRPAADCVVRRTRVWIAGRYVVRKVRRCY